MSALRRLVNEVEEKMRALLPEVPMANVLDTIGLPLSYAHPFWHSQETCPSWIMETNCYEWRVSTLQNGVPENIKEDQAI